MPTTFKSWTPPAKAVTTNRTKSKSSSNSSGKSSYKDAKGPKTIVKTDVVSFAEKRPNGRLTGRTYEIQSIRYDDNTNQMTVKWFDSKGRIIYPDLSLK